MTPRKSYPLSRRAFMASTLVAGIASAQSPAQPRPPIRAGLIGCGAGGRLLLDALEKADSGFAPTAVARQCKTSPISDQHAEWRELVERGDLEAIFIATPDHLHAMMAEAALRAGKHVYVLPPFTCTDEEARHLEQIARTCNRTLHVGMESLEKARWSEARKALEQAGTPRWILISAQFERPSADVHWQFDRTKSHGAAARQLFNMLYPLHYHLELGQPCGATALGGVFDGKRESTPDALLMTVHYDRGATVVMDAFQRGTKRPTALRMRGTNGNVSLDPCGVSATSGLDLAVFAHGITGNDGHGACLLRAAVSAQETVSQALAKWVDWDSSVFA